MGALEDDENSKEDWAVVLESWYDSRKKVQEVSGAIPGNSQLGVAGITNSPEGG